MKEIQFTEDELENLSEIGRKLFTDDENDPTSIEYKRCLVRPDINWKRGLLAVSLSLIGFYALYFFMNMVFEKNITILIECISFFIYAVAIFKKVLIGVIHLYQHFAPDSIRLRCRFEPSCSDYMIMAIEQYGVCKGVLKGIGRLKRCNINGGVYDYP